MALIRKGTESSTPTITTGSETTDARQATIPYRKATVHVPEWATTKTDYSFLDVLGAAFQEENLTGSIVTRVGAGDIDPFKSNESFDPLAYIKDTPYEQFADEFDTVDDLNELKLVQKRIDRSVENRRILEEAGWLGTVTAIGAAILDPIFWVPAVGPTAKAASLVSKGASTGAKVLAGANLGAKAAFLGEAVQSGGIAALSPTVTKEDAVINSIAAAGLGSLIGGGLGLYAAKAGRKALPPVEDVVLDTKATKEITLSIGDALRAEPRIKYDVEKKQLVDTSGEYSLAYLNNTVARRLTSVVGTHVPAVVRGLTSSSPTLQKVTSYLFQHSNMLVGNVKGKGVKSPVETRMNVDRGKTEVVLDDMRKNYKSYKKEMRKNKQQYMKKTEFNEEVSKAILNDFQHPNPHVVKSAKLMSKRMDELSKSLDDANIIKRIETPEGTRYFPIRWSSMKTSERSKEYIQQLADDFLAQNPDTLTPREATNAARRVYKKIVRKGETDFHTLEGIMPKILKEQDQSASIVKERKLDVDYRNYTDFIELDAERALQYYSHKASYAYNIDRAIREAGFKNIDEIEDAIKLDFDAKKSGAKGVKLKLLNRQEEKEKQLLYDFLGLLSGQYRNTNPLMRNTNRWMREAHLGNIVVASLSDVGMPIMHHGPLRVLGVVGKLSFQRYKNLKPTIRELHKTGIALDSYQNNIANRMYESGGDVLDEYGSVEKFADGIESLFFKVNGMTLWNSGMKILSAHVSAQHSSDVLLRWARKGKISTIEKTRLATFGIEPDMYQRIVNQIQTYDDPHPIFKGYTNHFERWTDEEAKQVWAEHLLRENTSTILTPGAADAPVWARKSNVGSMLNQYKAFQEKASQDILLRGVQRAAQGDYKVLYAFAISAHIGGISVMLTNWLSGNDDKNKNMTYAEFWKQGFIKAGLAGTLGEQLHSLNPWAEQNSNRWGPNNFLGTWLGPVAGVAQSSAESAVKVPQAIVNGDNLSEYQKKQLIQMVPFNNLFYLRQARDKLIED